MNVKSDTEYIAKTGHTIDYDGSIPLNIESELVRCKDCKHYDNKEGIGWCELNSFLNAFGWNTFDKDDYCSKGEMKGNG